MKELTKKYSIADIGFIEIYKTISNINIPKIETVDINDNDISVKFTYIEGVSLDKYTYSSENEKVKDFYQLCDIVKELHKHNIIHRDIKPENIVKSSNGEIHLIDFGISRIYKEHKNKDTTLFGSEYYAAPEQYGFSQTDYRTCIYQIGKTFEEIGVAKKDFQNVITKATEFNPLDRYQTINELSKVNLKVDKEINFEKLDFKILNNLHQIKEIKKDKLKYPNGNTIYNLMYIWYFILTPICVVYALFDNLGILYSLVVALTSYVLSTIVIYIYKSPQEERSTNALMSLGFLFVYVIVVAFTTIFLQGIIDLIIR